MQSLNAVGVTYQAMGDYAHGQQYLNRALQTAIATISGTTITAGAVGARVAAAGPARAAGPSRPAGPAVTARTAGVPAGAAAVARAASGRRIPRVSAAISAHRTRAHQRTRFAGYSSSMLSRKKLHGDDADTRRR